jgi:neutral ceramidase
MKASKWLAHLVAASALSVPAFAQPAGLRAGAAKVDITPAAEALPAGYEGILDRIYSRAIVLDSGAAKAALISVDAGGIPDGVWQEVAQRLERELGIPIANVLLTATHTHSAPRQEAGAYRAYADKIVESVRGAQSRLEPARIGYGTGVSYLNVNRNIIDPRRVAGGRGRTTRAVGQDRCGDQVRER